MAIIPLQASNFGFDTDTKVFKSITTPISQGSFNWPWNSLAGIGAVLKFHYKFVGLTYGNGDSRGCISTKNMWIATTSDIEGWFETNIDTNYDNLDIYIEKAPNIVVDVYLQINAFEVLPSQRFPFNMDYVPTLSSYIDPNSYAMASCSIPQFGLETNPLGLLEVAINRLPTQDDTVTSMGDVFDRWGEISVWSYIDGRLVTTNTIYVQKIEYLDNEVNDPPIAYNTFIAKFATGQLIDDAFGYISHSPEVEDFTLRSLKFAWVNQNTSAPGWEFTPQGLRSPLIPGYQAINTYNDVFDILGYAVTINYEIVYAPGTDYFSGWVCFHCGNSSQYIDTVAGVASYTFSELSQSNAWIQFEYGNAEGAIGGYILITSIEFIGRVCTPINTYSIIPSIEKWLNNTTIIPWVTTGTWNYITPLPVDSHVIAPAIDFNTDLANVNASVSYTVDCIDGDLVFSFGVNYQPNEPEIDLYIDGQFIDYRWKSWPFQTWTCPVTLGTHTFKFLFWFNSYVDAYINEIIFPTLEPLVYNYTNRELLTPTFEDAVETTWRLSADFHIVQNGYTATLSGTDIYTLSVDIPLGTNRLVYIALMASSVGSVLNNISMTVTCAIDGFALNVDGEVFFDSGLFEYSTTLPNTETATTIVFTFTAYEPPSPITITITEIDLPVAAVDAIEIAPIEDIVTFPCTCTLTIADSSLHVYYTLDDTDPLNSTTKLLYTVPFALNEQKIVKYRPFNINTNTWGNLETKHYFSGSPSKCEIFYHTYQGTGGTYTKLYTVPWVVPIIIGTITDSILSTNLYDGQPISVTTGQIILAGHIILLTEPNYLTFYDTSYAYSVDYSSFRPIVIADGGPPPPPPGGTNIVYRYAVDYTLTTFIATIIPSIPSGNYTYPLTINLRSNLVGESIKYSINSSTLIDYIDPISIIESSIMSVVFTFDGIDYNYTFIYNILPSLDLFLNYSSELRIIEPLTSHQLCLLECTPTIIQSGAVNTGVMSCESLNNILTTMVYSDYQQLVIDYGIYTLFSDDTFMYPFPFTFNLVLGPTDYFTIPDLNAAVYVNGDSCEITRPDTLVSQFITTFTSGANIFVVSDYCLRLCIDVDNPNIDVVIKVWTNAPINSYLTTDNAQVQLSTDSVIFARHIRLTSNYVYIKGIKPENFTYGNNIININIKLLSSEVFNESTF